MKQEKELFAKPIEDLTSEEQERLEIWQEAITELAQAVSSSKTAYLVIVAETLKKRWPYWLIGSE